MKIFNILFAVFALSSTGNAETLKSMTDVNGHTFYVRLSDVVAGCRSIQGEFKATDFYISSIGNNAEAATQYAGSLAKERCSMLFYNNANVNDGTGSCSEGNGIATCGLRYSCLDDMGKSGL